MAEDGQKDGSKRRRARGPRGPYRVKGTPRQLLYLVGLVSGKSKRRAAHDAGYKSPRRAVANLERAAFNRAVHEALAAQAVTLPFVARKVREGMEATASLPFLTRAGDIVYAKEQATAEVQLEATQFAAEMLGISGQARQSQEAEQPADEGAGNILLLARRFDHLTEAELSEAMRQMRERPDV